MRIVVFCHSLLSDWNHGNAHFLRGVVSELIGLGHDLRVFEPQNGWSVRNLLADAGPRAFDGFRAYYRYVPKGPLVAEYTIRLNQAGRFTMPGTRVEALYSPEMFGELPGTVLEVAP